MVHCRTDRYTRLPWCRQNVPDFTEPPNYGHLANSPDPNLVNYSISDALQQLVYRQKFKHIDRHGVWNKSCRTVADSEELIDGALGQWWHGLNAWSFNSHGGQMYTRWTSFLSILWSVLVANYFPISVMNCTEKVGIDIFEQFTY